jgi:sarcosine oxidase subunit alpha
MKQQRHRLLREARHGFGGNALDRSRPLTFRLNGFAYEAFEGDTILSALLAAGVDTAGLYHGEPIGLDERFAPVIVTRGAAPEAAMPMDRVPATAGASYTTLGPSVSRLPALGMLSALFGQRATSLGHKLDEPRAFEGAWPQVQASRTIEADTAVVGGGIAGMSAALAAADAGGRVVLIERRPWLGGDARFFGTVGDEDAPEATIGRLSGRIASTPSITLLLASEAFSLSGTRLRAHQVELKDGTPSARVVAIRADRVILATGTAERLPVFPGNRAPRVTGAIAAFHRAERHGVWQGTRALVATPHKFGYRLALLAADAGVDVHRVVDSRFGPQSRFIDFCKASGITLASSLVVRSAEPGGSDTPLRVGFAVALDDASHEAEPIATDLLIVAGGFQPRLALWLMAGGGCTHDPERRALMPRGTLDRVAVAGAAAGLRSSSACLASGEAAARDLTGKPGPAVEDIEVDAIYESRDDGTSIAPWRAVHRGAAFLDGGLSFTTRPPQKKDAPSMLPQQMHALSVGDVMAAVDLDLLPAAQAGIVAAERCLGGGVVADVGWRAASDRALRPGGAPAVPPWLAGRFGSKPQLIVVAASDGRHFEAGCLVYASSDASGPLAAIGAVIGPQSGERGGALVLAARAAIGANAPLFVRDSSGHVAVMLVDKVKPTAAGGPEA